jgi:hypothetical protein
MYSEGTSVLFSNNEMSLLTRSGLCCKNIVVTKPGNEVTVKFSNFCMSAC